MKVDFHFHTCLAKAITFDIDYFRQTLARAREQDMFAITITDHFDNHDYEGIYASLDRYFTFNGHYYLAEGVRFYPGIEVQVREGPHLLASGSKEDVLTLYDRLRGHMKAETWLTTAEYFDRQEGLDLLNIFAHPFRPKREYDRVPSDLLSRFEAFDLNAKDVWEFGGEMREEVEELAAAFHRPVVAGSDTHHFLQLGSVYNEFTAPFESIRDLRERIREGAFTVQVHPELAGWVEQATKEKKIIKAAVLGR